MKICGIDSATQKTGISLFDNGILKDYTLIDLHKNKDAENRIQCMMIEIGKQLDVWYPDIIYIEDTTNQNNVKVLKQLTQIIGAVIYWCCLNNKEINLLVPSKWRSVSGIQKGKKKRNELKAESMKYVEEHYNLNVGDDVADAILIGEAGCVFKENENEY